MYEFSLADLSQLIQNSTELVYSLEQVGPNGHWNAKLGKQAVRLIDEVRSFAVLHDLYALRETVEKAISHRKSPRAETTIATLSITLRHVRDALVVALRDLRAAVVSSEHAHLLDGFLLFGDEVHEAFPSARQDIKEAGMCLAVEANTAAVFHLMRSVEWAMRAFCVHLGFKRLKTHTKGGKVKYQPVAYAEWESVLNGLQAEVDKKLLPMSRGPKKEKLQKFYYTAILEIRAIRDAWRNHVMHTRAAYSSEQAHEIFNHVKGLMTRLATRISEA